MSLDRGPEPQFRPGVVPARRSAPFITAPTVSNPEEQLRKIIRRIDAICPPSTWEFVTSAGVEVSVTPMEVVPISFSSGLCLFYVKNPPDRTVHRLTFTGSGPGIGWGPLPGSITGSIAAMPSRGIGKIRSGPLTRGQLSADSFNGDCAVVEYSVGVGGGGSLFVIFFGASDLLVSNLAVQGPLTEASVSALSSSAVGFLMGTSVGVQAGLSATVYNGVVS